MNPMVYSTTHQVENILEALLKIEKGVSFFTIDGGCKVQTQTDGICHLFDNNVRKPLSYHHDRGSVNETRNQFKNYLKDACVELGVYSGNELFPISENKGASFTPLRDARNAFGDKNLWSRFTRYGRTRRRVLKKMIEMVKKDLKRLQEECETYTKYKSMASS